MKPASLVCPMCETTGVKIVGKKNFSEQAFYLARCVRCGQHFCTPQPKDGLIDHFYGGDYHAMLRVQGGTEKAFRDKFARYRDWVLRFTVQGRSLDIGTATGLFPSLLKEVGFDAEGLEINEASARWGEMQYGVRIKAGNLETSGLDRHSYDFISTTDVLEHMSHPLQFLVLVGEYLKPGGLVLVTFPDVNSIESRYLHLLARTLRRDWIWSCCHIPAHI